MPLNGKCPACGTFGGCEHDTADFDTSTVDETLQGDSFESPKRVVIDTNIVHPIRVEDLPNIPGGMWSESVPELSVPANVASKVNANYQRSKLTIAARDCTVLIANSSEECVAARAFYLSDGQTLEITHRGEIWWDVLEGSVAAGETGIVSFAEEYWTR